MRNNIAVKKMKIDILKICVRLTCDLARGPLVKMYFIMKTVPGTTSEITAIVCVVSNYDWIRLRKNKKKKKGKIVNRQIRQRRK